MEQEILHPKAETISDELLDFELWRRGLPSRQEAFAEYIIKLLPPGKVLNMLEVGSGKHARLSECLAEMGHHMTCMDSRLETDCILEASKGKSGEIKIHRLKQLFDCQETCLSEYDRVVAQEPCDAAEHVIRACLAQNTPFVMTLCGEPHRLISGEMPDDIWAWYDYLADIDPARLELELVKLYHLASIDIIKSRYDKMP